MADLVNTDLTWLQSGEPVTGGSGGSSAGVLNRPLVELLANDTGVNTRINTLSDDDGYVKKVISSIKITETDAATTARVQIDATGLKAYDGTNIVLSANESGGVTLGYGTNDQISLAAGVLTGKFDAIILGNASSIGIDVTEAAEYGLRLGNCTTGGYGPLHIVNAGVAGASNLHTTYSNAAVDTITVDSNHEVFIKTGASTWTKVGATAASEGPVSSAAITSSLSTDNAVILDQDGLTMRKAAGAVRFDVNEDGSWKLGNAAGANLDFTTGDVMTLTSATLTSCSIAGEEINSGTVAAARIADLSGTYAVVALGVTNGNSHDHNGGDGAQINHTTLSNIGSYSHGTIDAHIELTTGFHGVTASAAEVNRLDSANGIYITSTNTSGDGIYVSSLTSGASAIQIDASPETAINIGTVSKSGIVIGQTGAGYSAIKVSNSGSHGIWIATATIDGIHIDDAGQSAIEINGSTSDAITITSAGDCGIDITGYTTCGLQIAAVSGQPQIVLGSGLTSSPAYTTFGMIYINSSDGYIYYYAGGWHKLARFTDIP